MTENVSHIHCVLQVRHVAFTMSIKEEEEACKLQLEFVNYSLKN
jgi:hypothetical protein